MELKVYKIISFYLKDEKSLSALALDAVFQQKQQ